MPIPDELADNLRAAAEFLPASPNVQQPAARGPVAKAPAISANFDGPDGLDNSPFISVPPDPEMAAGPNHVLVVVNTLLAVYDKTGTLVAGPTDSDTFFSGIEGCTGTFDPNALYDEAADRFVFGIDGGGDTYCVAATATNDPTGAWNRYSFGAVSVGTDFFDYPHAGVGEDAIFMGANVFDASNNVSPDVWAIDKAALYAGGALPTPVKRTLGGDDTPQPSNLHGFAQGRWPNTGTHYLLSDRSFDGTSIGVWSWSDPFAANVLTNVGSVDLNSASGVVGGFPVDAPQLGAASKIQGNDFRVLDAEYRNGHLWMSHTISCNPGGGTVNCVRWAEIDPAGPAIVQAGVYGSDGEYRMFPDVAVNYCNDMTIGYTKSGAALFPAVYYSGRLGTDAAGLLQAEALLQAGEISYVAFDSAPRRWGDYTGATSDPDGVGTWYLGEYSKDTGSTAVRWGTRIGGFTTACDWTIFSDGFESGNVSAWSASAP